MTVPKQFTGERRRRERRGRAAETLAVWALRLKGYRIIARRAATPYGEIDILAARGDVLAVVEVKARPDIAAGIAAVQPRQRRRIEQAAAWYAGRKPALARRRLRFDIVVVTPRRWPHHIGDACRPD